VKSITLVLLFAISLPAAAWKIDSSDSTDLVLGGIGMVLGHELGHIGIARSLDIKTDYDGVTVVYPTLTRGSKDQLRVASGGFQAQWLLSELAFHYLDQANTGAQNDIAAGAVLGHLAITASYLTILKDDEDGDIAGMANTLDSNRNDVALLLAIPAILDAWRLFSTPPSWLPHVSRASKGLGLTWIWSW
jgi:hypothetical protein